MEQAKRWGTPHEIKTIHFSSINTINIIAEHCHLLSGRDGTQKDFFVLHFANITKYSVSLLSTHKIFKTVFSRVMEDVVDDFSTLGRVAARLGEWRTSDVDSYQSAYVSLVLHR